MADHLLFVHTLATGELNKREVEFLESVRSNATHGDTMCGLTVVLTNHESFEDVAERLTASILAKIEEVTGSRVPCFRTSATVHKKGMAEGKQKLRELSGVDALRHHCGEIARDKEKIMAARTMRIESIAWQLQKDIEFAATDRKCRRKTLVQKRKRRETQFKKDFRRFLKGVAERMEALMNDTRSTVIGDAATRDHFVSTMHDLASSFRDAERTVDREQDRVFKELNEILKSVESAVTSPDGSTPEASVLVDVVKESEATMAEALSQWKKRIDRFEINATFREDFDDSLLLLVHGLVKSGKSSLGNFVAHGSGDPEPSSIENIRDTGQTPSYFVRALADSSDVEVANEELNRRGKFVVDVEEATSSIQGFKLGGLTWIDSPGLGSVTERNATLTQKYTESADLVLVLMNMSQPGRRPEFEAIANLLRRGKPLMVLLTRADMMDTDEVDGRIVRKRVMKPDRERREAEEWVESQLREITLRDTSGKLLDHEVHSVSVQYAEQNPTPEGLERSGFASLFERLTALVASEGVAMKRRAPAKNLIAFIDAILTDTALDSGLGKSTSVVRVRGELTALRKTIDDGIRHLEERGRRATEDAKYEIVREVEKAVRNLVDGKESGSAPLRSEYEDLVRECEKRARDITSQHLREIVDFTVEVAQTAVTRKIELDVPRDTLVFEEIRRTIRYKNVTRGKAGGSIVGIIAGASIGFRFGGPAGAAVGAYLGGLGGGMAGGASAGEKEVEEVIGVDYNKGAARIAEALGEEVNRQINQCVEDLRKGCFLPIKRQAGIVEKRLLQFEKSLRGIKRSLENAS